MIRILTAVGKLLRLVNKFAPVLRLREVILRISELAKLLNNAAGCSISLYAQHTCDEPTWLCGKLSAHPRRSVSAMPCSVPNAAWQLRATEAKINYDAKEGHIEDAVPCVSSRCPIRGSSSSLRWTRSPSSFLLGAWSSLAAVRRSTCLRVYGTKVSPGFVPLRDLMALESEMERYAISESGSSYSFLSHRASWPKVSAA